MNRRVSHRNNHWWSTNGRISDRALNYSRKKKNNMRNTNAIQWGPGNEIYFTAYDFRDTYYHNSNKRVSWMAAWPFTRSRLSWSSKYPGRNQTGTVENCYHYDHICLYIHTPEIILLYRVYQMIYMYRFSDETRLWSDKWRPLEWGGVSGGEDMKWAQVYIRPTYNTGAALREFISSHTIFGTESFIIYACEATESWK